ncbi:MULTISPECIES: DsbA family oxidoreductase [Cytobacillus]|uniref:DsbA family oxidoreductase n=1 Tax=Cytobacillus TaxID=2675230 RepID=UPI001CD31048|nr:DsbA family oxidoreductase [Cytobacillus kochii]MCA1024797.1 DsbA family oxidoreductase [Cytobacillus kochii]MCM3323720.1 DsbA family oxidoreductase [Cytobacillus kochii]MCM3346099.1 DsbA family oxidoreductase [Cytobacillus kochii]MDM5206490.1 DsbA family oxidoreductase [Cytobacillus kochii]
MKVEIWSDIACPFCYIGKRKFEHALVGFDQKDEVEVVYKSFQLDPNAPQNTTETMNQMLAKKYGQSVEQVEQMQKQVTAQANEVGLDYHLNDAKMTNTLDAHRLIHLAKEKGKMSEMKEQLLKSYFVEGKHVGEIESLVDIAAAVGLDKEEVTSVLASDQYKKEVEADMQEGVQLGVQGVPFFVFNRKYAVSGAQPSNVFSEVLTKVIEEEKQSQPLNVIKQGDACTDGSC